jgi:lysophospholipase L1-like esterase
VLIEAPDGRTEAFVSVPLAHAVAAGDSLSATALVRNLPVGGYVELDVDGGVPVRLIAPPWEATFTGLAAGDHTVTVTAYNQAGGVLASDSNAFTATGGTQILGVGDSIVAGWGDNFAADNLAQSAGDRLNGIQGPSKPLYDRLDTPASPALVWNEGVGGDTSFQTLDTRIDSILERHPSAQSAFVLLGANDAMQSLPTPSGAGCAPGDACYAGSYKESMQGIVDVLNAAGITVWVVPPPPAFGSGVTGAIYADPLATSRNALLREYGQAVRELSGSVNVGPDLFKCFLEEENLFSLFDDNVHLNGLGNWVLWGLLYEFMANGASPDEPCPQPALVLRNLSRSTVSPYLKQNRIEIGDTYYVDETYTVNAIPQGLGLETGVWVMTANADRSSTATPYLSFDVDRPVTVYVAYDADANTLPSWLSGFADTGMFIQVSDPNAISGLRLYSKSYPAGTVSLDGNLAGGGSGADAQYLVIVVE